jgi:hypothetical protein
VGSVCPDGRPPSAPRVPRSLKRLGRPGLLQSATHRMLCTRTYASPAIRQILMFFGRVASAARSHSNAAGQILQQYVRRSWYETQLIGPNEAAAKVGWQNYGHMAGRLNLRNLGGSATGWLIGSRIVSSNPGAAGHLLHFRAVFLDD